jgi:hypothetical protein
VPAEPLRQPTDDERVALLDGLMAAIWRLAADLADVDPHDPAHTTGELGRAAALATLAVTKLAAEDVERIATIAATRAAELGADYATIGRAAGITRQGARRRWPGLAAATAAARYEDSQNSSA